MVPVKFIVAIAVPEHTDCDKGVTIAVGAGFTNTVALLLQLLVPLVMVNVT